MKKTFRLISTFLAFLLLCAVFSFPSFSKDLEPCYHCGSTGEFHCPSCGNQVDLTCDGCHGAGKSVCPGEENKGPCDHGYYTCQSCGGDGKKRTGDGVIVDGNCGNCQGKGKIECWHCHGAWEIACTRCGGSGKVECQNENCKKSRTLNWKCHYCMGAGYLLTNFWPGENDGVQNRPVRGDLIWVNGKSTTYGVEGSDTPVQPPQGGDTPVQPPQGGDTPVQPPQGGDTPVQPPEETGTVDPSLIPHQRNTDFEIPIPLRESSAPSSSVRVEIGKMTAEEQRYYAALDAEELGGIFSRVQSIVASAEPGRAGEGVDELLSSLAALNGFDSLQDGRLYPLYFEGHQDLGFPVRVTVTLPQGDLDGGTDLFVYHVSGSGSVEPLGKAECWTYEDGSVQSVSFYAVSFSSFFTASGELILPSPAPVPAEQAPLIGETQFPLVPVLIGAGALLLISAAAVVFLLARKKKR